MPMLSINQTPKLATYISAFNLVHNQIPYDQPLRDICAFFDLVVVAVNTSTDSTLSTLRALAESIEPKGRLQIIETTFLYTDVKLDGAVKNAALQECYRITAQDIGNQWAYVQLDLDETVLPYQYDLWRKYAESLLLAQATDCLMLPSVDLWGSDTMIRADKPIGLKFRLHKSGVSRGVLRQAWLDPQQTRFRIDMSDSTEPTDQYGNLVRCHQAVPQQYLQPSLCHMLENYPTVIHHGYKDLNQRIRVNKAIWNDHWRLRNGGEDAKVATKMEDLLDVPLVPHRLRLK